MITIYKRQTNKNNYIEFCCDTNDLTELSSSYLNVPNGSKAYILGTRDYYEYDKANSEWVLVEVGSGGSGGDIDTSKFVTKTGLATTLLDYVTNSNLSTELASYVTSSDLSTELANYITSSDLSTELASYVTSSSLSSTLSSYVTSSSLSSTLSSYATLTDLESYVTSTALSTELADYVTSSSLSSTLADYVTSTGLSTELADYVTSTSLSTTLADYVTSTSLGTTLADYVTSTSLGTTLSGYVETSDIIGMVKRTAYTNITVATSSWTTYETDYYKAEIPINGVTSTDDVIVNFSFNSIVSNDLMGIASTDTNKVIIYATSEVQNSVTIDSIFIDSVVTS